MKYCHQSTISHPLAIAYPGFLENINLIFQVEGGNGVPFNHEVALNLDKIKDNSGNTDIKHMRSMDMVIGMKENNNIFSLLVDFKLRCNNPVNISEGECRDKIKHSKRLLFGSGISVHNRYVFIFNDDLLNVSRRVLSMRLANAFADALSIDDLKSIYF